ncbi:MAG TPA: hypothetical protein VGQ83_30450 [Polyangia bacterium]|jgi:hypothetical protein
MLHARVRSRRVTLLGAVVLVLAAAAPAAAQDAATIKRLEQMNKRAMEDYDLLEFDSARKTLTDAVALVRSSGLEEGGHPIAAKTYLNLGVVYIGGFKDKDRGRMQFVRGLKVRPDAKLDGALATPELQEVFNDALKEVGKGRKPEPPKPEPPKPKPEPEPSGKVEGLVHEPVNEARAGFPIVVKAELGAEINAAKVLLFYRGTGREDYVLADMAKNKKGVYTGQIPADAVQGKVLQYYIEVRDTRGRPLIANGSSGSPNIISVLEAAAGDGSNPDGRVGGDDEDPLKAARIKKQREQEQPPTGPTIRGRRFWLTVGFGTGFGLATGNSECAWNEGGQPDGKNYSGYCVTWTGSKATPIKTGFASAPMHLSPELGFYLGERFALSVQARIQVLTLADPGAANAAPGVLGRALYFFGKEKVRYYVGGAVGGGYIRHRVALGKVATNADVPAIQSRDIVDTVKAGPFLFGPFAGVYYDITRVVGLQAEVNALAAAPDATFNIDINFGLNLNF